MTDLLQEVDDMMRRERMEKLWRDYGNVIIGGIVAIIAATAIFSGVKSWNAHVRQSQTESLIVAMEDKEFALKAQDVAGEYRAGLKTIALLNAAGAQIKDGKTEEALALLKTVAEDGSAPDDLAGLAAIMAARLEKPENRAGSIVALQDIASDSGNPWSPYASLEVAAIKAEAGDYKAAREALLPVLALADNKDSPPAPGLLDRARALDHVYGIKAGQPAAPAKEEG